MAAQATVAAIRSGCEMLSQGKAEIQNAKATVEKTISEAKAIYAEIIGLWDWFTGLFGVAPKQAARKTDVQERVQPKAPSRVNYKPKPVEQLTYEEYQTQAIHQICEQLKTFFEIRRQLQEYCHDLEEESKTTTDIEGAALDRIQIEMQLEQMTVQIRETMIYTPKEIGLQSIYSRFLKMYDQILEEREFDRALKRKQEIDARWQREYQQTLLLAKLGYAVVITIVGLWMTALFSVL
jgi:PHP family Zn ribbon phosphoesterase